MAKYILLKNRETGARSVRIAGGRKVTEIEEPAEYARLRKLAVRNAGARDRADVCRSLGLIRARNGMWE